MKKDIIIPKVAKVYLAAIQEWNDDFMAKVWNAYLINDNNEKLESVMVVSKAFGTIEGEMKKTSLLRHAYVEVPSHAAIKIEMIADDVLTLHNEFMLTYFIGPTLFDKKFIFKANSINENATREVPVLLKEGVLLQ
uniref:hypothetical protein n=1 Tax=Flavobacterium sp. TaxID=239 RepID=UPI004048F633